MGIIKPIQLIQAIAAQRGLAWFVTLAAKDGGSAPCAGWPEYAKRIPVQPYAGVPVNSHFVQKR